MTESPTLPDLSCTLERDTAPLYPVEDCGEITGLRALCTRCHRASPVLSVAVLGALEHLVDLGWHLERGGMWRCPVCTAPASGRYAICGRDR